MHSYIIVHAVQPITSGRVWGHCNASCCFVECNNCCFLRDIYKSLACCLKLMKRCYLRAGKKPIITIESIIHFFK